MHMQGEPRTMQASPTYHDAPLDLFDYFAARLRGLLAAAGIGLARIAVDPGIGFGKTVEPQSGDLLDRTGAVSSAGRAPLLLGVSRKSFIGRLSRGEAPKQRLAGLARRGDSRGFDQGCPDRAGP